MRKVFIVLMIACMVVFVLQSKIYAQNGKNEIYIYKKKIDDTTKIKDVKYSLWRVKDNTLLEALNQLDESEIMLEHGIPQYAITDESGKASFYNMENGLYYIREGSNKTVFGTIIKLPLHIGGIVQNTVSIFPKVSIEVPKDKVGEKFTKVDDNGKPLKGARFKLFTTKKDKDGKEIYYPVIKNGVVYVATSDYFGNFSFYGIDKGRYHIIEVQTPVVNGVRYRPIPTRIDFEVTEKSYNDGKVINVVNKPYNTIDKQISKRTLTPKNDIKIPKTGTMEMIISIISGSLLLVLGGTLYFLENIKKKSRIP